MNDKPYKNVWMVEERLVGEKTKTFWTKVGVGFVNRDGSITIELLAMPMNGKLVLRDPV